MASVVRQISGHEVEIDQAEKLIHISDNSGKLLMSITEDEVKWVPDLFAGIGEFFREYGWGGEKNEQ